MCGITGWVSPIDVGSPELLDRMTDRLTHRGPDDRGTWHEGQAWLGHRRLAVLDTGRAGRQPMCRNGVAVVHNGEIYNFKALRTELEEANYKFTTGTDTEVLINGYLHWGLDELLLRTNGMFAFAIWDANTQQLHLARDRMGQKPLYYCHTATGTLTFSSELRPMMSHPEVSTEIDPISLRKYLAYDYVPAPRTMLAGVQKLEAGARLTWHDGKIVAHADWWTMPSPNPTADDHSIAKKSLWSNIVEAVDNHLVSDVPLGLFLSGGLDSSAIAAAACEVRDPASLQTFCIGFDDPSFDESVHARTVANHLGTQHYEQQLTATSLVDLIPDIISTLDEPLADPSLVPSHLLARFVREHVTVALGGDGGDELFLGYPTFSAHKLGLWAQQVPSTLRQHLLRPIVEALPVSEKNWSLDFRLKRFVSGLSLDPYRRHFAWIGGTHAQDHVSLLEPAVYAATNHADPYDDVDRLLRSWPTSKAHDLEKLGYLYARLYLAEGVLQKMDRASMAYGLEARSPLLSSNVVTFASKLPVEYRLKGSQTKWIMRQMLKEKLPPSIIERPKKGFGIPLTTWLKGPLLPLCQSLLTDSSMRAQALFKKEACEKLIDEHRNGWKDHRKTLWALMVFQLWVQQNQQ